MLVRWLAVVVLTLTVCLGVNSKHHHARGLHDTRAYLQRIKPLASKKGGWTGGDLQSIFSWKFFLPEVQQRKGLVYTGSSFRLRRVIKDIIDGKATSENPIKIAVIGGSISW